MKPFANMHWKLILQKQKSDHIPFA